MIGISCVAFRTGSLLALLLWIGIATAAAAPAVHYTLDAKRSVLRFSFVQAGANNTGRFGKFTTDLLFSAENLPASKMAVTVHMASVDTDDKERDDTLKGPDLFDVAKFPQARFTATKFTATGGGRYDVLGKLTLRDITKDLKIPLVFQTKLEQGKNIGYMSGRVTFKRLEYGVGQSEWKSTEWVNDDVTVNFSLRLVPAAIAPAADSKKKIPKTPPRDTAQ